MRGVRYEHGGGVATGAAALAWSVRPSLDAEAVRDLLEETTQLLPLPGDEVGDGLVDAERRCAMLCAAG